MGFTQQFGDLAYYSEGDLGGVTSRVSMDGVPPSDVLGLLVVSGLFEIDESFS